MFAEWEKMWLLDRRRSTLDADWSGNARKHWLEGESANVHWQYIFQDGFQLADDYQIGQAAHPSSYKKGRHCEYSVSQQQCYRTQLHETTVAFQISHSSTASVSYSWPIQL